VTIVHEVRFDEESMFHCRIYACRRSVATIILEKENSLHPNAKSTFTFYMIVRVHQDQDVIK